MYIIILAAIIITYYLWLRSKETVDMPLLENVLLPVTGGSEFVDPNVRVLDPRKVGDPAYTLTTREVLSRPIISTTPQFIYRQVFG